MHLTKKQRDLLLLIGAPHEGELDGQIIDLDVVEQLITKGLFYYVGRDGFDRPNYDLTDRGEEVYAALVRASQR